MDHWNDFIINTSGLERMFPFTKGVNNNYWSDLFNLICERFFIIMERIRASFETNHFENSFHEKMIDDIFGCSSEYTKNYLERYLRTIPKFFFLLLFKYCMCQAATNNWISFCVKQGLPIAIKLKTKSSFPMCLQHLHIYK